MDSPILPGSWFLQAFFYGLAAVILVAAAVLVRRASLACGDGPAAAAALQRRFTIGAAFWVGVVGAVSYAGWLLPRDGPPLPFAIMVVSVLAGGVLLARSRPLVLGLVMAWRPVPRAVVAAWNLLGLVLLANIVGVAILSTPVFAYFGPDRLNVWVMWMPYTLLPAVMVLAAWAGHLIVLRALQPSRSIQAGSSM